MRTVVSALLLTLLIAGCDSTTDPGGGAPQGLGPPVATGLFLTDENGVSHGVWRIPTEGGLRSYPNPSAGSCRIQFNMQRSGYARCWVVAAVPPDEVDGPTTVTAAGGTVLVGGQVPVAVLLDQQLAAGAHVVSWNMNGISPDLPRVPTGFYRIYLQTEDGVLFNDHFGQSGGDYWLPAGLENWLF